LKKRLYAIGFAQIFNRNIMHAAKIRIYCRHQLATSDARLR
jgi:hypothetical protein